MSFSFSSILFSITRTPRVPAQNITSAFFRTSSFFSGLGAKMPLTSAPYLLRRPSASSAAYSSPFSRFGFRLRIATSHPSLVRRTAMILPTTPVPKTAQVLSPKFPSLWEAKDSSTSATAAAAVVYAPPGSIMTLASNGGNIVFSTVCPISSAFATSLPPMKKQVCLTAFGPLENMAS